MSPRSLDFILQNYTTHRGSPIPNIGERDFFWKNCFLLRGMKRDLKICLQALFKIHITCIFVKKRIMTTLTLKFQLDESLAIAYRQAQPEEKEDLKKLFQRLLTNKFRKQSVEDMLQRMDEIGKEAESNGLTEDIIDEILAKS